MNNLRTASIYLLSATLLSAGSQSALCFPVSVNHADTATCDILVVPKDVDELGVGFPPDEDITASSIFPENVYACPTSPLIDPAAFNHQVTITNNTNRTFTDLWYVADPETRFSNIDGIVNDQPAFKIDAVGVNRPLFFESITANGLFEPTEIWAFRVDSYSNSLGLPPSNLNSVGAVGAGSPGPLSAASIIAIPVPEPTSLLLFSAVFSAVAFQRSRKTL